MLQTSDNAIPAHLIEMSLERVLASRGFRSSPRKQRFLRYIVEQALAGHADRIKAYTIAVDAFDREKDFDPAADPVIRIEAGRLRRCLEQYYLSEGARDPVQITIPKGRYVPRFVQGCGECNATASDGAEEGTPVRHGFARQPEKRATPVSPSAQASAPVTASRGRGPGTARPYAAITAVVVLLGMVAILMLDLVAGHGQAPRALADREVAAVTGAPSLLVFPLVNETGSPMHAPFVDVFTEDLAGALIQAKGILVFSAPPGVRDGREAVGTDYVLTGSISQADGQVQVEVSLIAAKDRRSVWSNRYRGDIGSSSMVDLRRDIASQVVHALEHPQPATRR